MEVYSSRAHQAEEMAATAKGRESAAKAEAAMAHEEEEALRLALQCVNLALGDGDVGMARANIKNALRGRVLYREA